MIVVILASGGHSFPLVMVMEVLTVVAVVAAVEN